MSERLTDKTREPSSQEIGQHIGTDALRRLQRLEEWLHNHYDITRALRFPFGPSYGWGYKYSHKQAHLFYAFFETGAFTVTLQIGDARVPALENRLPFLHLATQKLWENRYPCGNVGGWVHLSVQSDEDLADAMLLIEIRKPGIFNRQNV
jgi:hypothetical protein